ncbi:MAG TPA: hypothetical protein VFO24_11410, partial [Usitatibacter sp.]|nr:hypothetical protein [Usitatibacter sp.]
GQLHRLESAPEEAAALFEETIRISRENADREMTAVGLLNLAMVGMDRDDGRFACAAVAEALESAEELRSQPLLKSVLEVAAGLATARGRYALAARLYGAAEAQALRTGLRRDPADAAFLEPLVDRARERLGAGRFSAFESEGRALEPSRAASDARDWLAASSAASGYMSFTPVGSSGSQ